MTPTPIATFLGITISFRFAGNYGLIGTERNVGRDQPGAIMCL
jgi:hypothetical protein